VPILLYAALFEDARLHPQVSQLRKSSYILDRFERHIDQLRSCRLCEGMAGRSVCGTIRKSRIIAVGQAPGPHEERLGRPFAYTAGRTLFKWMASIGIAEDTYRARVNMSAVCRCYPGKGKGKSGDRVPSRGEIENCRSYLEFEFGWHKPELVIPIGKLAIQEIFQEQKPLVEVIGTQASLELFGFGFDCIALPHPSGLNAWNNMEPGRTLIRRALQLIAQHPAVKRDLVE
jgi:uracil-DNA glycosylase